MDREYVDLVVDESPNSVVMFDTDGAAVYANQAALKTFGSRAGEIDARTYNIFREPFINEIGAEADLKRAFGGEHIYFQEMRIATSQGDIFRDVNLFPLRGIDGNIVRLVVISRDVTERIKTKNELAESLASCQRMTNSTIISLSRIIELRDPYTAGHQTRASELACAIAAKMGIADADIARMKIAGLVHDLGKILLPSEILSKPGILTDYEYAIVKKHPEAGLSVLEGADFDQVIMDIVAQHHERIDGSGYPQALKGDSITLEARIFAVADVVEAMAAHRPYRQSLGIEAALREIESNKNVLYDGAAVDACLELFREDGFTFTELSGFYSGGEK
jgi:PAS domain S-box-containing protein/putative nucleotidyltransferase with HDIG domain